MTKDIKRVFLLALVAGVLLAFLTSPASADMPPVFSDDFNAEHGGTGVLDYGAFAKWSVSDGTVDLIGNGFHDFYPGHGLYVDLDGSSSNAGILTTKDAFGPGKFVLRFDLGGNARPEYPLRGPDTVTVKMEFSGWQESFELQWNAPLTTYYTRTISTTQPGKISFNHAGNDNVGIILDNVYLYAVPETSTLVLAFTGTIGPLGYLTLRRRKA